MNNRYWLFAGECFYARGGMHDFCGSYESIELAKQHAFYEWWHVWDTVDGKCVAASERQPFNAPREPPKGE
jgi:hypothetical protein